VSRFTYHLFSSRTEDEVAIFLYDAATKVVGQVFFVADDEPLPPASHRDGITALYFPRSSLVTVLDLLRNEGPIELCWAGPFDTRLSTALEPVGEGE
jgi:hypothetical protein